LNRLLQALALLPLSLLGADPPAAISGTWEITRIIPTTNVQTEPDSKAIGKRFTYAAEAADLAGLQIETPVYSLRTVLAEDFAVDYRTPLSELGVEAEKIRVVEVTKSGKTAAELGTTVIIAGRRRLVTVWDGVFYEMRRAAKP
jgi:hypothetical protein